MCIRDRPATAQAVSGIGANAMTLNWTRGNGSECIVIMHQAGAVVSTPADGSAYIASTTFGSGTNMAANEYVVYMGSGTTCTVTGLNPNTSYSYSVFEFNGTGCTTNFLLSTPANGSATTIGCLLATEPNVQSSGLTTTTALSNSIQLSWTRGNGSFCIVLCKGISAITTPPVDGIVYTCLLYTSDAADERSSVDLGGRRIIKKKKSSKKKKKKKHKHTKKEVKAYVGRRDV